jgi:hypothetical protein
MPDTLAHRAPPIRYRMIQFLFVVSDVFAWLLLALSLVSAVAFPLVGPIHGRMSRQPLTTLDIIGTCAISLVVAAGAYAITRRKIFGLALVMAPAVALALSGRFDSALVFAVAAAAVFATPFLLVFLQARGALKT